MTQKILVTSPRITPDSTALMQAAQNSGQKAMRLPTFRPVPDLKGASISVYGEPLFAIILSSKLDHVVLEPTSDWLSNLPKEYTQREIQNITIGEARKRKEPTFVKNADGMKAFEAQVYPSGQDLPSSEFYPDDYEVIVSEPVVWEVEYRCFVMERKLITMSIYYRHGELAKSSDGSWMDNIEDSSQALNSVRKLWLTITCYSHPPV